MKFSELILLQNLQEEFPLPYPIISIIKKGIKLIINGKVAIPVERHASYYNTNSDISVFDTNKNEIGLLCFTKELGEIRWNDLTLTENRFIAFLIEGNYSTRQDPYKFTYNYLIVNENFYKEYEKKYMNSAPLWGGFYHLNQNIETNSHRISITEIRITEIKKQKKIFLENSVRAISQPFAFERFLKFYHLLELQFDFEVISQIKALDVEIEPERIGELLSAYSDREINRLEDILERYCSDINAIIDKLNKAKEFQDDSYNLFFKFSSTKQGNPFNGQEQKFLPLIVDGFEEANFKKHKISSQSHRKFIIKLSAYWIYRFRCSIAHNKIGEYILSMDKENYVVEFAEPLLKEVLIQCFKKK
jgi:hypothetical protein